MPFGLEHRFLFARCVAGIPFGHYIKEGYKLVALAVCAVDVVADSNKAYTLLPEENLGVESHLQIVAPQTAHIFDNDRADIAGLYFCHHFLKAPAFKRGAGYAVIGEVAHIGKTVFRGKILKDFFLIGDGIALTLSVIVAA